MSRFGFEDKVRFLLDYVQPGITLSTDGSTIYDKVNEYFPISEHIVDDHALFLFSHTSQIEGTFGNLKPYVARKYYHVSGDKLGLVVAEFCFKFNHPEIAKNPRSFLENSLHLVTTG